MKQARYFHDVEAVLDAVLAALGNRIVLGIPLGIGKPNHFVNALYSRVRADPALHLTIVTALSLEKPHGASELEKRFINPFVERVFGDYPDLDYAVARRTESLPPNVRVIEFFMKTGDFLNNDGAQQDYLSANYTNAARDLLLQGVNLLAQAVAVDDSGVSTRLSLSSNPDITLDLLDLMAAMPERPPLLLLACYNRKLPFMENQAAVSPDLFDLVLSDPASTHDLFAPPNMKVSLQDYAIGMYTSMVVKDGGTLQIGIGSLGDAIAQSLILRDRQNVQYREMATDLFGGPPPSWLECGHFEQGLYGCSEMFVNGFLHLIRAGLIRREVFHHYGLQKLLNQNKIGRVVAPETLTELLAARLIGPTLGEEDVEFLKHYGIFKAEVTLQNGMLMVPGHSIPASIADKTNFALVSQYCLGSALQHGILMHGGFFLGPRDFYQGLRDLEPAMRSKIGMSRISFINSLSGQEALVRLQRRDARFINTTMVVSLLGAASSDSLDSGRVVSGVGGQYNFVAMADALPDARSILMLRSTHSGRNNVWSNIVWSYSQTTIPRHLRDIVITEYGIADLRGKTDSECVKAMLAIADSRFQNDLLLQAKQNGKLEKSYEIPVSQRNNSPVCIEAKLRVWRERGMLPDFPFGTDFTDDEVVIVKALKKLKASIGHPLELVRIVLNSFMDEQEIPARYLERMQLDDDELEGIKIRLMRRLFVGNFG